MPSKRLQIGVVTTFDYVPDPLVQERVRQLARELAKRDVYILTGGASGGLLRLFVEEAVRAGALVISILPHEVEEVPPDHPWYDNVSPIRIWTGLDSFTRSAILVRSCDSIIAVAGGVGTLIEVCMAYGLQVPVVVLTGTGYVADQLRKSFPDGYLDHRKLIRIHYVEDPVEAVELAIRLGEERRKRRP